jgi:hypothetical protein
VADSDLTVAVLREIRDEIRTTNSKLDATRVELTAKIDETNVRLDGVNSRLEIVETTLKDLAGQQLMLTRYIKNVVDRHDTDID